MEHGLIQILTLGAGIKAAKWAGFGERQQVQPLKP